MHHILLPVILAMVLFAPYLSAQAQLQGEDTSPGESCAEYAQGATRMNASPSQDGTQILLICDGDVWRTAQDSLPVPPPCFGTNEALQWTGSEWFCACGGVPHTVYTTAASYTNPCGVSYTQMAGCYTSNGMEVNVGCIYSATLYRSDVPGSGCGAGTMCSPSTGAVTGSAANAVCAPCYKKFAAP